MYSSIFIFQLIFAFHSFLECFWSRRTGQREFAMTAKGGTSFNVTGLKPFLCWQKYSSAGVSLFRSIRNSEWNKTKVGEDGLFFNFQKKYFYRRLAQSITLIGVCLNFLLIKLVCLFMPRHRECILFQSYLLLFQSYLSHTWMMIELNRWKMGWTNFSQFYFHILNW